MPRYASGTSVTVDRSITQIRQLVLRFGADKFAVATGRRTATVAFAYKGRPVKFDLSLPDQDDPVFLVTETGRPRRNPKAPLEAWDRECRAKWRSLHLLLKALFVAIEEGLLDFDRAFMHDIVMPDGRTVGQKLLPVVQEAISRGDVGAQLLLTNS
jgi:hypothetical protein